MALFVSSCSYTNPAFPESLKAYLPYEEEQNLTFKNADDEIEQYTIGYVYADKEEKHVSCKCRRDEAQMLVGGKTGKLECVIYAQQQTKYFDNGIQIEVLFKDKEGNYHETFQKNIICDPFSESAVNDIGDTILINNEIGDVTVVRNKGITEYTINGTKWTLVE